MDTVLTRYGEIPVAGCLEWHDSGALKSCAPAGPALLATPHGALPPQYSTDDLRRRTVQAVYFYDSGALRHLPLETRTEILTPAGPMLAELVTFHKDGALARVFPLNGKLSGYWTQEDEGRLAGPVTLNTPLGPVSARLIGVSFRPDKTLRSLTLWPGESLDVATPAGVLSVRIGVSFRPDGSVESLEPARPQGVQTPVGLVRAFDLDACGIHGDLNSLTFAPDGSVQRVATSLTVLVAVGPDGRERRFAPASRESLCGDSEREPVPLWLDFSSEAVAVRSEPEAEPVLLPTADYTFRTTPHLEQFANPFGKMACSA
ncbi:MAG: hypothetical protein A2051_04080 [Desulfovibrionales bacterium GWA2_65_9]|nr:MAG: hypothetical protein A2051_04080 [Desulfovibrionales bacterium GWA2_65_9]